MERWGVARIRRNYHIKFVFVQKEEVLMGGL